MSPHSGQWSIFLSIHLSVYLCIYLFVSIDLSIYTHTHTQIHICIYVRILILFLPIISEKSCFIVHSYFTLPSKSAFHLQDWLSGLASPQIKRVSFSVLIMRTGSSQTEISQEAFFFFFLLQKQLSRFRTTDALYLRNSWSGLTDVKRLK